MCIYICIYIYVYNSNLFVHGALTSTNVGTVPEKKKRFAKVKAWVGALKYLKSHLYCSALKICSARKMRSALKTKEFFAKVTVWVRAIEKGFTHCNALHRTAPHCNALQRTATRCNAPQHTATHCNKLQTLNRWVCAHKISQKSVLHCFYTVHCNTLQQTTTHCNTLQYCSSFV